MKKLIAIFILLAGGGGAAWWYMNYGKPKEKPQILTAAVSRQDIIEVVQATGALEATRLVQVGSQVSGTVQDLFVDFNFIVKQGQVIAKIDPTLLEQQVMLQQAALDRQQGDLEQSKVTLENDRLNLSRQQQMFDKDMIPRSTLESALLQVKAREAGIRSSEKSMLQTEASLKQARLNVDFCTIKSPVDGVIVNRIVDRGQAVSASQNVAQFFTIATDLTMLKLTAGVDEADIGKVRSGMEVKFKVESYGAQEFTGTVDTVKLNATTNSNVVTYPVWITVPNRDLKLRPSMTATVRIIISTAESALRIPSGALRFKPNKDIYAALQIPEPAAGQGARRPGETAANGPEGNREGGQGANAQAGGAQTRPGGAPGANAAATASPAGAPGPQAANGQQGRGNSGRGNSQASNRQRGGGGGFGGGTMNLTPDQVQRMQAGRQGRGGGGGAGRGGGRNQPSANAQGDMTPLTERNAEKIDELFQEPPRKLEPGTVYTWDEAKKELKPIKVTVGVTDGQFSELISGEVTQGMQLVTNVMIPQARPTGPGNSNLFMGNQPRGGMGGMMPGGGGPGGGGAGGGGGGGGRGGGGGGRGGN